MMRTTKKVIRLATRLDIMMGSSKWPKTKSTLHSFRDLLQLPLNNSCRITLRFREKTIAVVHFFQDKPFLLRFQEDMTGKLVEGTVYVFEFKTFEVELPADEENPDISDYMYSIDVTNYRVAEDSELGLDSITPTVEIISK